MREIFHRILTYDLNQIVKPVVRWIRSNRLLSVGLVVTLVFSVGFHLRVPGLNGTSEHRWAYIGSSFWIHWICIAPYLVVGGALIWFAWRSIRRRPASRAGTAIAWILLMLWAVFYHWLSFSAAGAYGFSHLGRAVLDGYATSYYTVAQEIDSETYPPFKTLIRDYPHYLPQMPLHASTHPPGPVAVCYGLRILFSSSDRLTHLANGFFEVVGMMPDRMKEAGPVDRAAAMSLGCLLMICGLMAAIPLWWLVLQTWGRQPQARPVAWSAAILWLHYPALVLFDPEFDQLFPLIALICIICVVQGLEKRPFHWGIALGVTFMLGLFLSFTMLLLIPLLSILAILDSIRRAGSFRPGVFFRPWSVRQPFGRRLFCLLFFTVITALLIDLVLRLVFDIRLAKIFFAALRHQNGHLLLQIQRTYWVWLPYNVYDWLVFGGPALMVFALVWWWRAATMAWRRPDRLRPAMAIFPIGVIFLALTGLTPGETARIWLFLAPGLVCAGAAQMVRTAGSRWPLYLGILLAAQAVFLYVCRTKMYFIGAM